MWNKEGYTGFAELRTLSKAEEIAVILADPRNFFDYENDPADQGICRACAAPLVRGQGGLGLCGRAYMYLYRNHRNVLERIPAMPAGRQRNDQPKRIPRRFIAEIGS